MEAEITPARKGSGMRSRFEAEISRAAGELFARFQRIL